MKNNPKEYNKHKKLYCEACGCPDSPMSILDVDHVKTRGSGGSDHSKNLLTLCRSDHIHKSQKGLNSLIEKYPHVEDILTSKGWEYDDNLGKFIAPPEARR